MVRYFPHTIWHKKAGYKAAEMVIRHFKRHVLFFFSFTKTQTEQSTITQWVVAHVAHFPSFLPITEAALHWLTFQHVQTGTTVTGARTTRSSVSLTPICRNLWNKWTNPSRKREAASIGAQYLQESVTVATIAVTFASCFILI